MAFQKEVSEIIHNLDEGLVKGGVLQEDNCFELTSALMDMYQNWNYITT